MFQTGAFKDEFAQIRRYYFKSSGFAWFQIKRQSGRDRSVFPYLIPDISLFYGAYVSAVKTQEPLSSPRQRKTLSGWCILVMFAHWHDPPIVV